MTGEWTTALHDELVAGLIENGQHSTCNVIEPLRPKEPCERPGIVWAIRYLSQRDIASLGLQVARNSLLKETGEAFRAEERVALGFQNYWDVWVNIPLSIKNKTEKISLFVSDIALLFALRNKRYPEELKKLDALRGIEDAPQYRLDMEFWIRDDGKRFIKYIRIHKDEPLEK